MDEPSDLLTVREVAKELRVDDTTVRRWIKNGVLEAITLPHRGTRQAYRSHRCECQLPCQGSTCVASALSVERQNTFSLLSVFPAKPSSFSEAQAQAVSSALVELLDELIDAGLLTCVASPQGRWEKRITCISFTFIGTSLY